MIADVNYSHSKNIGESIGHDFCGVPINAYSIFDLELDVAIDAQKTILRNRAMGCSDAPSTAEILPGEVLCSDSLIRRETSSEVTGHGKYSAGKAYGSEKLADLCALYSIMGSTENLRGHKSQSTPEELCAWLNNLPKRSFKSEVVTDGEDKSIRTTDAKGVLLHSFSYVGGLPGTYQGGEEVRLLDLPQRTLGLDTPSRVIQYFDNGNAIKVNTEPVKEYADEWVSNYAPTSHVERMTIGGTAFFAPEEETA